MLEERQQIQEQLSKAKETFEVLDRERNALLQRLRTLHSIITGYEQLLRLCDEAEKIGPQQPPGQGKTNLFSFEPIVGDARVGVTRSRLGSDVARDFIFNWRGSKPTEVAQGSQDTFRAGLLE